MDDVKMDFRAEQYEQALSLKDSIAALSNWQTFFPYRPKTTPKRDPRAWWRYAFVCVRGKPQDWGNLNKVLMSRKEYVFLFEKLSAAGAGAEDAYASTKVGSSQGLSPPLTPREERRLCELEEELPLQTILMFRTMARKEIKRKRDAERAKMSPQEVAALAARNSRGGGWWGSMWGRANTKKEDGDLALQDLTASFGHDAEANRVPPYYLLARVTVQPHGSMRLYGRRDLPLVEASIDASATVERRENASMACSFRLARLEVLDLFTQRAVFPHLLKVGGHEEEADDDTPELKEARAKVAATVAAGAVGAIKRGNVRPASRGMAEEGPLACLNASLTETALKVDICALPTDVAYNREVVDAVVSVFSARPAETKAAMSKATKGLEVAQEKTKKELPRLSVSISLDVAAPRVVVPVSSSLDAGFVLLDMGHMLVEGGSVEGGAMAYRAELSDMNVRFPAERSLLLVRSEIDAVIEPFKIKADVTVGGDVSKPGMTFAVEVMPGVRGVMSLEKIRGLLRVLDYVTKADLGRGGPPVGLAAPNTSTGGGGLGVERMGEVDGLVAIEVGSSAGEEDVQVEPLVSVELHMKLPTIGVLLVQDKDATQRDNGLFMEAAGMSMDVKTTLRDMTVQLHLDAVTVQDRARPHDSPFRNMIYSKPDDTSHGGLIHVTYWASTGGVALVPPASIADTNQKEYDMVVDARFSTLQMALDKESVIKATPFYRAVMRQDESQHSSSQAAGGGVGGGFNRAKSWMDDTRSVRSAGSHILNMAKRITSKNEVPKAFLAKASLTSVLFELVRSDPWETVMRAGISGLYTTYSANEVGGGGMDALVTLADILVTDVRPEANGNPFTVILAPLASTARGKTHGEEGDSFGSVSGLAERAAGGRPSKGGLGVGGWGGGGGGGGGGGVDQAPLVTVTAKKDGEDGALDAGVKLASFACNFMVDPIKECLVVLHQVNLALLKMLGSGEADRSHEHTTPSEGWGAQGRVGAGPGSSWAVSALEEREEYGSESTPAMGSGPLARGQQEKSSMFGWAAFDEASRYRRDGGTAGRARTGRQPGGSTTAAAAASRGSIRARLELDDWRINLIEEPSKTSSKVVVLRASWLAVFTRSVTSGEGGDSTEDRLDLSLLKTECLVDTPPIGGGSNGAVADRRISQVLEPFSAEVCAVLLSAKGALLSAKLHVVVQATRTRISFTDMMLVKAIAQRATAAYDKVSSAFANNAKASSRGPGNDRGGHGRAGLVSSILPETYEDASDRPGGGKGEKARVAAMKAATRAGLQPSNMVAVSFSARCSNARVVLVNDYEGQGVPVLSFSSRELKAEGNGFKEEYHLNVSGTAEVGFFNVKVVRWEPLCEPWQPVLTATVGADFQGRRTVQANLSCEKVVVFDVTADFMESFLSTYWMLFSDGGAKDDPFALVDGKIERGSGSTPSPTGGAAPALESVAPLIDLSEPSTLHRIEDSVPSLKGPREGTVTVRNKTGLELVVGTTDFPQNRLKLGAQGVVHLPFETRGDEALAGQLDLCGKAALVAWDDPDMQRTREALPPLKVDRKGVHVFPLLPTTPMPSGYVASAPVVVEAFQSQRYNMMTGVWSAPYMSHDGPEFTTKDWRHGHPADGRERPLESIALPDERLWAWRDDWHVDFSKAVGTEIDEAGWEYRVEMASFNLIASSRTRRDLDQARRRKWIRTRAPKPLPMNDPFRPLHLAWQIDVTPQGRLEATIRSTVQLTNSTGLPLEVRALCSAWPATEDISEGPGRRSLGFVAPGCTLDVPVMMVYASHLQLRPTSSSGSSTDGFSSIAVGGSAGGKDSQEGKVFEWSAPLALLANNVDTSRDDWVSCRQLLRGGVGAGSEGQQASTLAAIKLAVHAETTAEGCVVMTILPPVTVVNALPCPLSFRAFLPAGSTAAARRDSSFRGATAARAPAAQSSAARLLESGRIETAETAYLHTLEVGDGAKFGIKIGHHQWSSALQLLPLTREQLRAGRWATRGVTFKLPCSRDDGGGSGGGGDRGHLEIRCLFEPRVGASCPALRLHVFCTHWLVDRSGLRLGFGISDRRRLPVPVVRGNETHTSDVARSEASGRGQVQQPRHARASRVEQVSCANTSGCVVSIASVGGPLYTDREYVFKEDSLPRAFRGATMIRTSCSEKNNGSQRFLRFRVADASTVHVLFDRRCSYPPSWLTSAFHLTATRVHMPQRTRKGKIAECSLVVWSRDVPAGSWVNLGGNRASEADTMYVVIITGGQEAAPTRAVPAEDVAAAGTSTSGGVKRKINSQGELLESWTLGTEGLALCNAPKERLRVAVPEGAGRGIDGGVSGVYGDDGFGRLTRDAWSDELDIPGGANGVFQVKGTQGEIYELALRAEVCPGTFRRTTQVTVIPRFCMVNLLEGENIWLKEAGVPESSAICIPPGGRLPWHWMLGRNQRAGVKVRTEGTAWSYGDVVINRVGTTAVHVPFVGQNQDRDGRAGGRTGGGPMQLDTPGGEQTVVHVDVQLADDPFVDEYSLLVVFWKANERFAPIYSARNASPVTVHLHQAVADQEGRNAVTAKDVWKLQSGERCHIGWAYPAAPHCLLIYAGRGTRAVELNTDTVGNYVKVPTGLAMAGGVAAGGGGGGGTGSGATGPSFVWASVIVKGASKVIHISSRPPPRRRGVGGGDRSQQQQQQQQQQQRQQQQYQQPHQGQPFQQQQRQQLNSEEEAASKLKRESEAPALEVAVDMRGFGLSLIGPVDGRRQELLYAQISNVRAKLSRDRLSSVQASIGALQVDNHLPDSIYPVLLSKRQEEPPSAGDGNRGGGSGSLGSGSGGSSSGRPQQETPFLQLSIIKEVNQATNTAHYDYVAFRMLEVDLMSDRATLLHLLVWCKPLQGYLLMWRQQLDSPAWVVERTAQVLERGSRDVPGGSVDVEEVRRTARIQRKYFKTMQFHPIILRLSYVNSPASDELVKKAGWAIINKIPTMVKSRVDLASYLVEDAFGTVRDISKNVMSHYFVAATSQVLSFVGAMRALGSPADLISNIGGGAKALVYAPAQGLVQGPAEFFEGVGRGAHSFVKGTVKGVFNSVAGVGGAVTDTVSKLSFDNDYQLRRERDKNKAIANQGGVGQGLLQGSKDIAGGLTSGVSGIFMDPVSGAKKGGVGGFFKGVGKGLVGAVVKPVVGVTDSVISVAQGISNEAENVQRQKHLRPRRALTSDSETGQLVLLNFSMEAAEAQALVESGVEGKGSTGDKYESHTQISDLTIIFADTRMILVKRTKNDRLGSAKMLERSGAAKPLQMVSKPWEEVARVDAVGESIVIGRYNGGDISLKAAIGSRREELYRQFYVHRDKMGDPTAMRTPDEVFGTGAFEMAPPLAMTMRAYSTSMKDSLKAYTFGSACGRQIQSHGLSNAQARMKKMPPPQSSERQLQTFVVGNWSGLDYLTLELIQNWSSANVGMNSTRCLCVVFINASTSPVQFLEMSKRDGQGYRLMIGPLCDVDSQQLLPGGVAILFAWGHPSTNVLKKGFVAMVAETTAFSAVFAVEREKVTMSSKSGFQAGFLEKTMQERWSKQVVVIK
ncbi:unnamed protein product [Ectocarpus sp. 4 AP-2014]